MGNILIKVFIINKHKENNRKAVGYLSSITGIISNIVLFIIKLIIGLSVNSIAVMADSFNNLSDVGSSLVSYIGFKLSDKPADKEHPFGHGRTEYISAMIISIIIMLFGYELLKSSISRLMNPEPVIFESYAIIILVLAIIIKLWLSYFNKTLNKFVDSKALEAASLDSIADVFSTGCVLISMVASRYTKFPIDGVAGIIVAALIVYNGFNISKSSLSMLLGAKPDPNLMNELEKYLLHFDGIIGVHDMIIHDYGPNTKMATVHIEISASISAIVAHEIIDNAERKVMQKFGVNLLVHYDPVRDKCSFSIENKDKTSKILDRFELVRSMHDFRIIRNKENNTMVFDVVVDEKSTEKSIDKLKKDIIKALSNEFENYEFIITFDKENHFL